MNQEDIKKEEQTNEEPNVDDNQDVVEEDNTNAGKNQPNQANRNYAQGFKKGEAKVLAELGFSNIEEAKKRLANSASSEDVAELKATVLCNDLDVKKEYREDVIALVKGKGLTMTEESIKSIIDKHPEWKRNAESGASGNVISLGASGGKAQPSKADEREEAKKLFTF